MLNALIHVPLLSQRSGMGVGLAGPRRLGRTGEGLRGGIELLTLLRLPELGAIYAKLPEMLWQVGIETAEGCQFALGGWRVLSSLPL